MDGTNNERLFGFQGSLDYSNNNLFHGGEKLMLSFKSSFEIQLLLTDAEQSDISNNLNTREIGPEFHYYLPKYFLIIFFFLDCFIINLSDLIDFT